jgi:hypothetical protein
LRKEIQATVDLPAEYDIWSEVADGEEEFDSNELALHKPMCHYVMNNDFYFEKVCIGQQC